MQTYYNQEIKPAAEALEKLLTVIERGSIVEF